MAFLRRFPRSPFWFGGYTQPDGRRVQRSTKQTDRKKAQSIADKWEEAAKLAAQRRLGEAQSRRILSEIYATLHGEALPMKTARQFLTEWSSARKADTKPRTHAAYAQIARDFIACLGSRADLDISMLTKADVAKYRDTVRNRTSIATANKSLKYLRVALKAAWADGLTQDNPAAKIPTLKKTDGVEKRAFTLPELKEIFARAEGEWRGLILFGLYTGQRLRDIATTTWANLDLQKQEITLVTQKTGRRVIIPLVASIAEYLQSLPSSDDPHAPVFPRAYSLAIKSNGESRLSQQFHSILVAANLASERKREKTGLGRSRRRTVSPISFHSLRHTATSLLKNAGVTEAVAMDIIGHDSKAISQSYTHIDEKTKRAALEKLPRLA
ncbi:MAG: tyrosine-type recombinase/integrase [Verrucomicrobia bacterium]|nr:tyrosine-type recombinase/integrase [Verrucomicrobiota bacterium]